MLYQLFPSNLDATDVLFLRKGGKIVRHDCLIGKWQRVKTLQQLICTASKISVQSNNHSKKNSCNDAHARELPCFLNKQIELANKSWLKEMHTNEQKENKHICKCHQAMEIHEFVITGSICLTNDATDNMVNFERKHSCKLNMKET